jgi:hypothetical protein
MTSIFFQIQELLRGAKDVMSLAQVSDHNLLDLVVQRDCVL